MSQLCARCDPLRRLAADVVRSQVVQPTSNAFCLLDALLAGSDFTKDILMTYEEFAAGCEFTLRDALALASRSRYPAATLQELKVRYLRLLQQTQDRLFRSVLIKAARPVTFKLGPKRYRSYPSHWEAYLEAIAVLCHAIDSGANVGSKVERYQSLLETHRLSDGLTVEIADAAQMQSQSFCIADRMVRIAEMPKLFKRGDAEWNRRTFERLAKEPDFPPPCETKGKTRYWRLYEVITYLTVNGFDFTG